jgi:hypothetical protein
METSNVEKLNIFLILISAIAAFIFPFELFLFSYIVLGPLHYLTELYWLKERNFFTVKKIDKSILIAASILIFIISIIGTLWSYIQFLNPSLLSFFVTYYYYGLSFIVIFSLSFSLIQTEFFSKYKLLKKILICLLNASVISSFTGLKLFFAVIITTLVHVFIFTLLFIWIGAIKSNSFYAKFSLYLYLLLVALLFLLPSFEPIFKLKDWVIGIFNASNFNFTHSTFNKLFSKSQDFSFQNPWSIKLQRFIAFAYTYHYLNWFSKVEIIGWHKLELKKIILILSIWITALSLYSINYTLGFTSLLFLSILHVIMEFPLNSLTIKNIFHHYTGKKVVS